MSLGFIQSPSNLSTCKHGHLAEPFKSREMNQLMVDRFTDNDDDADGSETACLIRCPPDECGTDTCCPPAVQTGRLIDVEEGTEGEHAGHSH